MGIFRNLSGIHATLTHLQIGEIATITLKQYKKYVFDD